MRGSVNTLDTSCNQGTLVGKRIRRLTPRECFALQGFRKEDCDMLSEHGLSDTQLYKMAGNSICVPVLQAIFHSMQKQGLLCLD